MLSTSRRTVSLPVVVWYWALGEKPSSVSRNLFVRLLMSSITVDDRLVRKNAQNLFGGMAKANQRETDSVAMAEIR